MSTTSLLPANADPRERALEGAMSRSTDLPVPLRDLWNADTCPINLLPWLAWALSVREWDSRWPEAEKRETIRHAIGIHRIKGTVTAVKDAIRAAGYGVARLQEGNSNNRYDGTHRHDGLITYGAEVEWARYRIELQSPVSAAEADQIRRIAEAAAPARCHLVSITPISI